MQMTESVSGNEGDVEPVLSQAADTLNADVATPIVNQQPSLNDLVSQVNPNLIPTSAADRPGLKLLVDWTNQIRTEKAQAAKSQVVKNAIELFKQGKIPEAFALFTGLDGGTAMQKILGESVGAGMKKKAEIEALKAAGEAPSQLEEIKGKNKLAETQAKSANPVIRKDENSPTGFSMITKDGVLPYDAYGVQPGIPKKKVVEDLSAPPKPQDLRSNEIWEPETNKIKTIAPAQKKSLLDGVKNFNKETQKMVEGINSGHAAVQAIENNAPGAEIIEKMRLIRQFTPRPAVQEVLGVGKGQGWETWLNNQISTAEGKGMGPQEKANMLRIAKVFQSSGLEEYNTLMLNRVNQISKAAHISEGAVAPYLGDTMPTPVQQALKNLHEKGTKEDIQAVEWASEQIKLGKIKDPHYQKAKDILKAWGLM